MKPLIFEKNIKKIMLSIVFLFTFMTAIPANAQETEVPLESPPEYKTYPAIFEAKHKAILSAELDGILKYVKFDVGDKIKKGTVVATVDTRELSLKRKRSELALKHLDVQVRDLTNLRQKGLATNEDAARAAMERDVTKTDMDIYKHQIANSNIRAPFNCIVIRRHSQPHEWATAGQPVLEVVSLEEIRAVANIPSELAVKLEKGSRHTFYVNDLNAEVAGSVLTVAPQVDERSNTTQVIWEMEKTEKKLLPGMKGEVRIDK